MAQLAIQGHATRGKEVIKILEMLGGKNLHNYCADYDSFRFYIGKETNIIYYDWVNNCYEDEDILVFTLEEFLEKFPYKVGDKVIVKGYKQVFEILSMRWCSERNDVLHSVSNGWFYTEELQPHKEEVMDKAIKAVFDAKVQCCDIMNDIIKKDMKEIKIDIPAGYEFAGVDDDKQQVVFQKIQPQYPKTYEECCKALMGKTDFQDFELVLTKLSTIYEEDRISPEPPPHISTINALYKLLICRDAYWKIVGEQMGLGKPWEPDWENFDSMKYCIRTDKRIVGRCIRATNNRILSFPTEEICDAFYENFKELINQCKELL